MSDENAARMTKFLVIVVCLFALGAVIAWTCRPKPPPRAVQNEVEPLLDQAAKIFKKTGWVLLPYPDSKYHPGAVIRVAEGRAPDWIGDLVKDCGVPPEVLQTEMGATPPFDLGRSNEVSVNAVLHLKGVEAGPSFNDIRRSEFQAEDHGADAFSLMAFKNWLMDPDREEELPEGCRHTLSEANTYIIREAYRVSKGMYSFKTGSGAALSLKGIEMEDYLKISPEAKVGVTDDGSLTFDQDVYVAVRRLKYWDGKVETLSDTRTDDGDGDKILLEAMTPPT